MAMECDNVSDKSLEFCLSVTDIYHAKRIIEALYEQKRFEKNLFGPMIGLFDQNVHIGLQYCVYLMLMMTTKLCGLLKTTKPLLPQEEGSYDDNGLTISTRPSNISEYGT